MSNNEFDSNLEITLEPEIDVFTTDSSVVNMSKAALDHAVDHASGNFKHARRAKHHQRNLQMLLPNQGKVPQISTRFWVPSNKYSVAQLTVSYDHDRPHFRSEGVLAALKLEESLELAAKSELPTKTVVRITCLLLSCILPTLSSCCCQLTCSCTCCRLMW